MDAFYHFVRWTATHDKRKRQTGIVTNPRAVQSFAGEVQLSHTSLRLVQALRDYVEHGAKMTWRVYVPDAHRLTQLGYPKVSGCCSLFHDEHGYGRDPNRYLRDRYRGRWVPQYKDGPSGVKSQGKRPTTSKGEADRLAHFLNWIDANGLDVNHISYEDVLFYQDEMTTLRPSGIQPSPATRNQRADVATFYLMWRADLGLRASFDVTATLTRLPIQGRRGEKLVYARTGRLPVSRDGLPTLSLPTPAQKLVSYSAVRKRLGEAKMLAARSIVEIGLRAFENAALHAEQWPSKNDILKAQRGGRQDVPMRIVVGKGDKERIVGIPLPFALMVREWIDYRRHLLVRPALRDKGPLFVSDSHGYEGIPLSQATIYNCFKIKVPGGPDVWYPHLGRHDYACNFILAGLRHDATISGNILRCMRPEWVTDRTSFWINMLRKRLGHVSETTTDRYLQWIAESYQLVEVADSYADFLDGTEQ